VIIATTQASNADATKLHLFSAQRIPVFSALQISLTAIVEPANISAKNQRPAAAILNVSAYSILFSHTTLTNLLLWDHL
jgi:hypothetical protein